MRDDQPPVFDKHTNTGFAHFRNAARFSLLGMVAAVRHESAFRQELALLIVLIPVAIWIARSVLDFAAMLVSLLLVLVVELLNSAVESAVDRIGPERHELSARAKDYGSAAVFIALTIVVAVWGALIIDRWALL